jgi:hypothetical protein
MPDFLCYGPIPSMSLPPETWSTVLRAMSASR